MKSVGWGARIHLVYIVPYGCHHGMCFWFSCWRRATFVYCACRRCIWAQQILLFQWLRAHTGSCHNGQINKLRYPQAHRNYCTTALLRLQNKSSKHFFYFLINLSWIIHKLDDEKLCKILYSFFMKRQLLTNANEYFFFDSSVYKLVALVVRLGVEICVERAHTRVQTYNLHSFGGTLQIDYPWFIRSDRFVQRGLNFEKIEQIYIKKATRTKRSIIIKLEKSFGRFFVFYEYNERVS